MNFLHTHIVVVIMALLALTHTVAQSILMPANITSVEVMELHLYYSRMYGIMAAASCFMSIITNMRTIDALRVHQVGIYSMLWCSLIHTKLGQVSEIFLLRFSIVAYVLLCISFIFTDILETSFSREILNTPILDNAKRIFRFRRGDHSSAGSDTSVSHVQEEKEVSEDDKSSGDG